MRGIAPRTDTPCGAEAHTWLSVYSPATSIISLGVLGFFYALSLFSILGVAGRELNLALFLTSLAVLPLCCAAVQIYLLNPGRPWAPLAASINIWTVVVGLLALTAAAVIKRVLGAGPAFWTRAAAAIVAATLAMHVIAIASLFWLRLTAPSRRDDAWFMTGLARLRAFEVVALSAVIFVTTVALFRIETFSFMTSYPLLAGFRSPLALTGACALLLAAAGLFRLEAVLERRNPRALARIRSIALLTAAAATCVLYFDFSLSADPQHYLTNVGPAVHLLHGGRLMVDTFSQYGPGPVVATMLGFMIGPISFGTANLTVQFFNLAFYIIFLACLYRMTSRKLAALLLGVFAIGAMFAIWFWGQWSLNAPPSVLGFRYLPCLVMVLALSEMRPPKRWSPLSAFATCFAALWSLETLAGTLGLHLLFLLMLNLRKGSYLRLPIDALTATLPAAAAILLAAIATRIWVGSLPDYGLYLHFFVNYNMLASYWGIAANGLFWGWVPMLLAYLLVLAGAWMRAFDPNKRLLPIDDAALFYRYVPMAGLLVVMGAYYAGRAVDFTAVMAFLPFCAIAIPAALETASLYRKKRLAPSIIASIPILAAAWTFSYSFVVLYGAGGTYSFAIHECRDKGNCSLGSITAATAKKLREPAWLDHLGPDSREILQDAVALTERWAADRDKLVMLLGDKERYSMFSDVALLHTGKWHLWPRSVTFADELNSALRESILSSAVKLHDGDIAIIRRDETTLGPLEEGLLRRIRANSTLCTLPSESDKVVAYRVSLRGNC